MNYVEAWSKLYLSMSARDFDKLIDDLLADKNQQILTLQAMCARAADALESQLPQHEPDFVTPEMVHHLDLIAELRKAGK